MKQGYTGDDLKQYQEKLGITADGIFGKQTDKAVRDFQTKNNLTVDGIIGKNTIGAFSKQNNSMDVNELGNVPDMSGLPTAPEPTMRKTPDFNNLLKTAQDFYKQDEVTTLERERQQGIVTALQGQGGRADLLASLGDEAGLGTKREAMTAASGKLERLQAEEDTLYDQMRQEESEGRGLRTTSAYQGESTRRARRIGIDKRYAAADLLATQGDYQGALEQVNQAVEYEFADRADMLTAQKQQLEWLNEETERKTGRKDKELSLAFTMLEREDENIALQKEERNKIGTLALEVARLQQAPANVIDKIYKAENMGEALMLALPYMSTEESIEIKTALNESKGLTGTELFKTTTLNNFSTEEREIAEYIIKMFPENPDVALAIAMGESNLKIDAHGDKNNKLAPEGSHGIFQINTAVHKDKIGDLDVNDWKSNIDIARKVYDEAGGSFKPWGAFTNGSYKNFLEEASDSEELTIAKSIMADGSTQKLTDISVKDNLRSRVDQELNKLKDEALKKGDFIGILKASAGGKDVSDTFINSFEKGLNTLYQVSDLQNNIKSLATGPIWGTITSNNPYAEKSQIVKTQLSAIVPNLARGIYGEVGVLTDKDIEIYSKTLPNLTSTNDVNKAVLGITIRSIQRSLENKLRLSAKLGRDVSGMENIYIEIKGTADELLGLSGMGGESSGQENLRTKYNY